MNYDDAKLRDLLAGEYVLGTMPPRTRARFERLMQRDAGLRRLVGDWEGRFAPLDEAIAAEMPPARVWQGIVAKLPPVVPAIAPASIAPAVIDPASIDRAGLLGSLVFWRSVAASGLALAAALFVYVAVFLPMQTPGVPTVVAVLSDQQGKPAWIATAGAKRGEVVVAALAALPLDTAHSFELWAIAGGAPKPLGILAPQPGFRLAVAADRVPPAGGVLAVSLEPEGGSRTGSPTGPVLYQGQVLADRAGG